MTPTERRKPGRPALPPEKVRRVVGVRLMPAEVEAVHRAAEARGITASALVREAVVAMMKRLDELDPEEQVRVIREMVKEDGGDGG